MAAAEVEEGIQNLWQDVRELSLGSSSHIDHLPTPPTPLNFLRHYINPNKPCLISSAATRHWPALSLWPTSSYLRTTLSNTPVSVHLTPTGKADSLTPNPTSPSSFCFASADVRTLPFPEALDMVLNSSPGKTVAYLQQQNDCFRSEYGELAGDCDKHIDWATAALGCLPEAVNLWVGNQFSETSFHKDHYENIYVVISGEKHFLLLPPTDVHRMYIHEYPAANYQYEQDSGDCTLVLEDPTRNVPWCSVDPHPLPEEKQREIEKFPLYFNGPKPFEVTVKAGEMLYLPSMWFHHVAQSPDDLGLTIAINYWYDMPFDIKYAYFNFVQSIPYTISKDPRLLHVESSSSDTFCNYRNTSKVCDLVEDQVLRDESDDE